MNTNTVVKHPACALGLVILAAFAPAEAANQSGGPNFNLIGYASTEGGTAGGQGGQTNIVTTADEFRTAAGSSEPLNIIVSGSLDLGNNTVKIAANKTIIGVGADAGFVGHLFIEGVSNIILRNLSFANPKGVGQGMGGGDGMTANNSHHVWVDHCSFEECADGQFDITHGSDFFTISWCKFSYTNEANGHRLSMLIGNKDTLGDEDTGKLHVTLHHNWISDLVYDRAPRVRFGQVHIFNNYYAAKGNNICIGLGISSQVLLESSYFDDIKRPWKTRSEGSGMPGRLQCNDDIIYTFGPKIQMGETNAVSFKPTYAYQLDAATEVKDTVMKHAGTGQGPFATSP